MTRCIFANKKNQWENNFNEVLKMSKKICLKYFYCVNICVTNNFVLEKEEYKKGNWWKLLRKKYEEGNELSSLNDKKKINYKICWN